MIFLFKGKRRHKIKRGKERNSRLYYMDVRRLFIGFEIMLDEIGKL